jgi:hypothetical protein
MDESQYIPGMCNIGPAEITVRRRFGWIGLGLAFIVWILFAYLDVGRFWFLLLFFPSALSAVGFIQGFMHFCAGFGMRSVFNMGSKAGKTETIMQADFRAKDRKTARKILGYSAVIGLLVSFIAYLLA